MRYAGETRPQRLRQLQLAFLLAFTLAALGLAFWSVFRAPELAAREDNPRRVEAELRIQRGRILDDNGEVIAQTVGPPAARERVYPSPTIGPAVGYYSFRHGTAGVEEAFDSTLRGESENFWVNFWRDLLHQPQVGQDIRLTLDTGWQRAADALLGDYRGAMVLLTPADGAIRIMVSHPGYDPNLLDEQFEELIADEDAPLLNRATQSQYQPGLAMAPFLVAAALERGSIELDEGVPAAQQPVAVNGETLTCLRPVPPAATWLDVLQSGCAAPLAGLGTELSVAGLTELYDAIGFTRAPAVPLTTAPAEPSPIEDVELAAVGQDTLTVTPLQMSLALAALAAEGRLPHPQLVTSVIDAEGNRVNVLSGAQEEVAISAEVAQQVLQALPRYNGLIAEYVAPAVSGPEGDRVGWYLALAPADSPQYALVVTIEGDGGLQAAQQIGRALLRHILAPE